MGLFSSKSSKVKIIDPLAGQKTGAADWLLNLMRSGTPQIPTRGIVETPAEKTVEAGLTKYAGGGLSDAYSKAKTELEKIIGGQDITKLPEYEPIISRVKREGDETVNRLLRRIQRSGMATSSPQGKQLGQEVGRTQDTMLATLAPFAEAERSRRFTAIPQLADFGRYETEDPVRRAAAVRTYGSKTEQARADEAFNQMMMRILFPYQYQAPLAGGVTGTNIDMAVTPGTPSALTQMMPLIATLGSAYLMSGAGAKAGGGGGGGYGAPGMMN